MRYRAPTIQEAGGLEAWLNSRKDRHKGADYALFVRLYTMGVNPSNIARAFGQRYAKTVKHWIAVYKQEQNIQ